MGAQTSNEQIPQTPRVESEYYSAAKSMSKSRRIFPPGNKQNKSKDIYPISLQFSQINSIEHQASRPSESFMGMFTSRHHQSISQQKVNLSNYNTLGLPAYNYKSEDCNIDEGDVEYKIDQIYKGMKYNGSMKDFKPHGKGILESEYEHYEGYFKNGVKHFHGRQYLANEVYEGEYFEGRRKGMGVLYTKLKVLKGQFHEVFVKGVIEYKDGNVYEGEVDEKENKIKKGKFTWAKGMSYSGEFQNNNFNGFGVYVDIDRNTYEGYFLDGLKSGQGVHYYQKQDHKYQGYYLNNKKHGKGKYWSSVSKNYYYQGQFKQDKPHNKGILRNQFGERKVVHYNGILKYSEQQ